MNDDLRKRIRAFARATSEQQDLMAACAFLESGKRRQGARVRPYLLTLQVQNLAVCYPNGWRLTRAGREAAATYRALGVAMCEAARVKENRA
jgi:hypothetical protein